MNVDSINKTNSELSVSVAGILKTLNDILIDPTFSVSFITVKILTNIIK